MTEEVVEVLAPVEASGGTPELISAPTVDEHIGLDATLPSQENVPASRIAHAIEWLEHEAALTLGDIKELIQWAVKKI